MKLTGRHVCFYLAYITLKIWISQRGFSTYCILLSCLAYNCLRSTCWSVLHLLLSFRNLLVLMFNIYLAVRLYSACCFYCFRRLKWGFWSILQSNKQGRLVSHLLRSSVSSFRSAPPLVLATYVVFSSSLSAKPHIFRTSTCSCFIYFSCFLILLCILASQSCQ